MSIDMTNVSMDGLGGAQGGLDDVQSQLAAPSSQVVHSVLNLYAGIGGNRKHWRNVKVTAVESEPYIAEAYKKLYPEDTVIVGDAHQYLLDHYKEFDFIWSSPPCPSHGQYRFNVGFRAKGYRPLFPDMKLYEEIIFFQHYYKGLWVVENVKPYYKPLIEPAAVLQRHLFWSNFYIEHMDFAAKKIRSRNKISDYPEFDITSSKITNKRQVLRNAVDPELGLHVLEQGLRLGTAACNERSITSEAARMPQSP